MKVTAVWSLSGLLEIVINELILRKQNYSDMIIAAFSIVNIVYKSFV